jgi:hypothetical protein
LAADFVASPVFDMQIISALNKGLRQEDIVPLKTLFFEYRVQSIQQDGSSPISIN